MGYSDVEKQKQYQRHWHEERQAKRFGKNPKCSSCGKSHTLTKGTEILCINCLRRKSGEKLKIPPINKQLQVRKRKCKLQIRRRLDLPNRYFLDDEIAWAWLLTSKKENDDYYGRDKLNFAIIRNEIKSPALQEIGAEIVKIYDSVEKDKTPQNYVDAQLRVRMCRTLLSIIALERFLKTDGTNRKMIPILKESD